MYGDKDMYRCLVVDRVIGDKEESWIETIQDVFGRKQTAVFHRDDEYHAPIWVEKDIEDIALSIRIASRKNPYIIDLRNAVLNGIDEVNYICNVCHAPKINFTEEDMAIMQEDLLQRLSQRLAKYSGGKKLIIVHFALGRVGFSFHR